MQTALPARPGEILTWGRLYGSAYGLAITTAARLHAGPLVVITPDTASANRLEEELRFYGGGDDVLPILAFPDWETLPYDVFSPHQDIISQRLATLQRLPTLHHGVLVVPVATLMHRVVPPAYLQANSLVLDTGQRLDIGDTRTRLEVRGYRCVTQVMEHGEFAVRGSILDLYPMGSPLPYRIELFDNEIESMRTFDPETQRSVAQVENIRLLPAREVPLNSEFIAHFRAAFENAFPNAPLDGIIYRDVSKGLAPPGIEYYLPLFFQHTAGLLDYLPDATLILHADDVAAAATGFWEEIGTRYEQGRHDLERPLLPPERMFLDNDALGTAVARFPQVTLQHFEVEAAPAAVNFATGAAPGLRLEVRARQPTATLMRFLDEFGGRVLFAAESTGRRETLLEILHRAELYPTQFDSWHDFLATNAPLGITVSPLQQGLLLEEPPVAVIAEAQLFGEQALQRRRRAPRSREVENVIRNLTELSIGAPVVHDDYGVGRYRGLQILEVGGLTQEYLTLEYADGDKVYVPVSSLHLINRYTGAAPELAPLHKLGSGQWERARRKAAERIHDAAAELLEIYARRAARKGHAFPATDEQYAAFIAAFPFEETPDQYDAIHEVLQDMATDKSMDRVICGDVGFGKTEVALRAAFMAVQGGTQVALLVPTTLLAQQHYQTFSDRFADWPVHIEALSRFRSKKQQDQVLAELAAGTIDIVIGTHKLLQPSVKFKNLGLVIVDEEHRFGVRHKERLKALRSEVDMLTLTATPIPRTLNMAMSGLRDLSIIATPPLHRLAIKTFVTQWNSALLREACLREIRRGGQVYFLHNEVRTIERVAREVAELVPEAMVRIAHGQMREHELEQAMLDFYHQRFNVLVCTTIIESGIDVPSANTIIINRADKLGLAQLYQLRGRVGRSHHRAYAYLVIPPAAVITADARKRLEAIESLEELGAGFMVATHDLEIRGAGELLGEEQSGNMQEIGFSLYTELLERAVTALKAGQQPQLDRPLDHGAEIDLQLPALLPEDYIPDVHTRLIMYKRIASANNDEELRDLQVEMIDRFGLLPPAAKTLFRVTGLKLKAQPLGIKKIEGSRNGAKLIFGPEPHVDPMTIVDLIQRQPDVYKFDGKDKLRVAKDLQHEEDRFAAIEQLIDTLAEKKAA